MPVTLALSALCENPARKTGLSTLFPEFVSHARREFPDVRWIVFAPASAVFSRGDSGIEWCTDFAAGDRPWARLCADHFRVAWEARRRGASALLTVGFVPLRTAGLPVAMQVFAVDPRRAGGGLRFAYRSWSLARGRRRAALVITNSEWARGRLGPVRAPVVVSPEGLRHAAFNPEGTRGSPGLPKEYLLWASNLYPYKRIELALRAIARLSPALRQRYPLVVVGGDWGEGRLRAEAEADRLGLRQSVVFAGWVDDGVLPALYRGARAHVLPTAQETFGRSVLEALACGCPCVVQDLPVLREVAGDNAQFVDFEDAPRAAEALERVCVDEDLRSRLVAGGVARAGAFGFERLARERVGAILKMLAGGSP